MGLPNRPIRTPRSRCGVRIRWAVSAVLASHPGSRCYLRSSEALGDGTWRSLAAHLLWEQGVAGSNPAVPTRRSIVAGQLALARPGQPSSGDISSSSRGLRRTGGACCARHRLLTGSSRRFLMSFRFQVTFDAADPERLAAFWGTALGYVEQEPPEGYESWEKWARSVGIPEERWNDAFARVDAEVERLVGAGATRLKVNDEADQYWVVMQDPEGNEFCLQ